MPTSETSQHWELGFWSPGEAMDDAIRQHPEFAIARWKKGLGGHWVQPMIIVGLWRTESSLEASAPPDMQMFYPLDRKGIEYVD